MVAAADLGRRPAARGPQGRPVLPPLRHGAELARGRAGLRGRRGPLGLRALPGGRGPADGRDPRTAGSAGRLAGRLDDHPVDPDLQRRACRRRGHRVRARARRRRGPGDGARARGASAGGGRRGAEPLPRRGPRGNALRAAVRLHHRLRTAWSHGADRRLRDHGGRDRDRPHGNRLRRGRFPARGAIRHQAAEPGPRRRHLRRAGHRLRRASRQGRRPRDHRVAARARQAAAGGDLRALLPALLALRDAAPLLREGELVHPHDRGPRPDAGRERDHRLAPRARQARALRQAGSRATSTGPSRASATGARRCRSGSASRPTARAPSAPARSPSCASAPARSPTTCTGPTSTR